MARLTIPVPNREAKAERRVWVRIATGREVRCQPLAAKGSLGRLRDISVCGLALLLRRFFAPGSLLIIELSDKANRGAHAFPVQVVHVTPEAKRLWIIGCEFLRPLNNGELQTLLAE
jgi:hypothetical protein